MSPENMSSFTSKILSTKLPVAVKKIDSKLECSICLENYKEPKLLPCYHVFCKSPCLEKLVVQGKEGQTLTCPACRKLVTLPDNGVDGLQTDFHVEHLFEIRESLEHAQEAIQCENCQTDLPAVNYCTDCTKLMCEGCTEVHQKWGDFKHHQLMDIKPGVPARALDTPSPTTLTPTCQKYLATCQKHLAVKANIYCETCEVLICSDCTVSVHKDHQCSLVDDLLTRYTRELRDSLHPLKEKLDEVRQTLAAFDSRAQEIKDRETSIESSINLKVDKLLQCLEQRREQLLCDLQQKSSRKLKELAIQRDSVEMRQSEMSSCLESVEECLRQAGEGRVPALKDSVLKRVKQISAEVDLESIQPQTEADMELIDTAMAEQACQGFGRVVCDPISAECSHVTGSGLVYAIANYQTSVEVHLVTAKNRKAEEKVDLSAELVHIKNGAFIKCGVNQRDGRSLITYRPIIRGRHSLLVRISGESVQGSPFPIAVTPSLENLRKPRVIRGLSMPQSPTTNSKRQVLVIECVHHRHCVTVLTPGGEKLLRFDTRRTKNGQLDPPIGLTVNQDNNSIYIVDKDNHCIQKFTSEGQFVSAVGSRGSQELQFESPSGMAFDKVMHHLYVCDQLNHRVQVLTADLQFVRCFGTKGDKHGELKSPMSMAFDESNSLYVTDCGNDRVQVFTAEGEFLRVFSNKTNGEKMQRPVAIAIDSSNIVYVSEQERATVGLFTSHGKHMISFGSRGGKDGQFQRISGIHIDHDDSILVSDYGNNLFQIF